MPTGEPDPATPPVALAPQAVAVLRQLAIGFGVHRLYGGTEVEATRAAATRIAAAVRDALSSGGFAVTIESGHFLGVPSDEHLDRLAAALFERRIEHLVLTSVPSEQELAALFGVLRQEPAEVHAAGGLDVLLAAAQVSSVQASEDAPDPASGEEAPEHLLPVSDWASTVDEDPDDLAMSLELLPEREAARLFDKLRDLAARLPDEAMARSSFYREVAVLAAALPQSEQPVFGRMLLDAAAEDRFAERALGHLSDLALADLVLRVARAEGADPLPLARQAAEVGDRHASFERLVLERGLADNQDAGPQQSTDDPAGSLPSADRPAPLPEPGDVEGTGTGAGREIDEVEYGDTLLASYERLFGSGAAEGDGTTADTAQLAQVVPPRPPGDARLRAGFPEDEHQGRALAATALIDLLANEPREEHLLALCAALAERLRLDVAAGEVQGVQELVRAWQVGTALLEPPLPQEVNEAVPAALDVEVVTEALRHGTDTALLLLAPFGAAAVGHLVAILEPRVAPTLRRSAREVLDTVLSDHLDTVGAAVAARSADARREVIASLSGVGGSGVAAAIGRVAQHRDQELHLEALEALTTVDPAEAAPVIGGIVTRTADRRVQRRGLEVLALGGSGTGRDLLRRLADRSTSPLPRRVRRRARKLAEG